MSRVIAAITWRPTRIVRSRSRRAAAGRIACHAGAKPNAIEERMARTAAARIIRMLISGVSAPGVPTIEQHRARRQDRDEAGDDRSKHAEQQVLGQQLADDAAARGADGEPDRELTVPSQRSRQDQEAEVHACGHQDEADQRDDECEPRSRLLERDEASGRPQLEPLAVLHFIRTLRAKSLDGGLELRFSRRAAPALRARGRKSRPYRIAQSSSSVLPGKAIRC